MKLAASVLVFAIACLTIGSLLWLRASGTTPPPLDAARADAVLAEFERQQKPDAIDLAKRYAGRRDLLDPRLALPAWHRFPREQAVAVHHATRSCPPGPITGVSDASLAKAYAWHERDGQRRSRTARRARRPTTFPSSFRSLVRGARARAWRGRSGGDHRVGARSRAIVSRARAREPRA